MITATRAYDLIYLALRECGIVSIGDTIDPGVSDEALLVLNSIRAEWSLNVRNNKIYDQTYVATANKQFITLGTDSLLGPGDIPVRPSKIDQVTLISSPDSVGVNIPLAIRPYEMYRQISVQNVFAMPNMAFLDTSFPYQNVWLYPGITPGWTLRVQGWSYMTDYENVADQLVDPPEYFSALYLTLALKLAPKWGVDLAEGTVFAAKDAVKYIKGQNFMMRMRPMQSGLSPSGNQINFFSGLTH